MRATGLLAIRADAGAICTIAAAESPSATDPPVILREPQPGARRAAPRTQTRRLPPGAITTPDLIVPVIEPSQYKL
jgi:hypothetical protein